MSNLSHVSKKIKSVGMTSRITHALEVISTSHYHSYKELQSKALPYFKGVYKIFFELFNDPEHDVKVTNQKFLSFAGNKREMWVIIGSDIGMCGDMNDRLQKYVLDSFDKRGDALVLFGRKLVHHLEPYLGEYIIMKDRSELKSRDPSSSIRSMTKKLFEMFMTENYQKLSLLYVKDAKSGTLEKINILPFTDDYFENKRNVFVRSWNTNVKFPDVVIDIFPQYLECVVLSALLSSKLGEHAIRKEMMYNATKNANELLDEYRLLFNKMRQANITQEITEIVVASKFKDKR